jgi:hypothetical protein
MFLLDEKVMADNRSIIAIYPTKADMETDDNVKNGTIKYIGSYGLEDAYFTVPNKDNPSNKKMHEYKKLVVLDRDERYSGDFVFKDNVFINKKLVVGELDVIGTTTNIDTTNLTIEDNLIEINKNETGAGVSQVVSGIQINRGTKGNANIVFDESKGKDVSSGAFVLDINGSPLIYVYETGGAKIAGDLEAQTITANTSLISKNTLTVEGAATLNNILTVVGATTLQDNLQVNKNITATIDVNTHGNFNILDAYSGDGVKFGSDGMNIYTALYGAANGGRLDSSSTNNMYITTPAGTAYGLVFKNGTTPLFQIEGSGQVRAKGGILIYDNVTSTWRKPEFEGAVNSFSQVAVPGQTTVTASLKNETINLEAGPGMAITTDAVTKKVVFTTVNNHFLVNSTGIPPTDTAMLWVDMS